MFAFVLPLEAFNQVLLRWQKVLVATLQPNRSQQSTSIGGTKKNGVRTMKIDVVLMKLLLLLLLLFSLPRRFAPENSCKMLRDESSSVVRHVEGRATRGSWKTRDSLMKDGIDAPTIDQPLSYAQNRRNRRIAVVV